MLNGSSPSLADIAAVTDNNNDGWGNGAGWWWIIILFAIFGWGGWGNGYGNNGQLNTDALDAALQRGFDNAEIMNKLDALSASGYQLAYDHLGQMNNINTNLMQSGYDTRNLIQQAAFNNVQTQQAGQIANMQGFNGIQASLANQSYQMATDTCAVTNAISQASRDITDNANANYRAIHDELVQSQLDAKNDKIAELQLLVNQLNLAQSQANQNQYLINQLRPAAVPSFTVPNPYASYGYGCYCNSATTV